jgi:GNAT superfamily N-acetyltransferase
MSEVTGLAVRRERSAAVMATLQRRSETEIQSRFDAGHRAYVASLNGEPAAWGWVATSAAVIGELKTSFSLGRSERYLWNFVTLPAFRGRGIYPRLLAAIIDAESVDADAFWIAYAPENHASGSGIQKVGFELVAELSFGPSGEPVVKAIQSGGGESASRLLGLPQAKDSVAQCWKCARASGPRAASCPPETCSCDYQRPEVAC